MTNSPSGQQEQTPPKQNPEPETPKDPPPQRERNFQRQNPSWNICFSKHFLADIFPPIEI